MAKAQGIIGNFKGKVGNMVGYQLTDSNNKQTQGIRIYQPNVKNPKTSAQAEQRAKLAPINATYRALKMIIDRGNEGLPYGNKSRLAWLKSAFKAEGMPWFEKGSNITLPVACGLTKGSLPGILFYMEQGELRLTVSGATEQSEVNTIGKVSTLLMAAYPGLKKGDQITMVGISSLEDNMLPFIVSFQLSADSTEAVSGFTAYTNSISYAFGKEVNAVSVIVSREGATGEHLRSNSSLLVQAFEDDQAPFDADSKTAAIASYMATGAANTDWPQESID